MATSGTRVVRPLPDQISTLKRVMEHDTGGDVRQLQRTGRHSFHLNAAGRCEAPVRLELVGRPYVPPGFADTPVGISSNVVQGSPLWLDVDGRCRRCRPCLEFRRRLWTARAIAEIAYAPRTWFVTLTLRPDRQFHYLELARGHFAARGQDLDLQDPEQKFAGHAHAVQRAVTLMLKRIRKKTKGQVRYLSVVEMHKSGQPHVHMLVHDLDVFNLVRKTEIETEWHEGFSQVKLVDKTEPKAAYYVCKYIAKDLTTRIRASLHYGTPLEAGVRLRTGPVSGEQTKCSVKQMTSRGFNPIELIYRKPT